MLTADPIVWDAYLQICVIIGDDVSDGGGAQSHADVENNNLNGEEEVQETSMHEERIGEGVDEDETTQDAIESRSNARGSRASTSSISSKNGNKRKKTKDNIYVEKLSEIAEAHQGHDCD
ncbi:hypothetical protein AMTR_s00072p00127880 [Amborella trichopoda]|uniref:Uncharacterized protein n=1 Tax=Amborella trichopoda TaxID=13333 RepID=W1NPB0_AMBTC|nr:hypothetical protein AMTR_s00072p00127880 [Amborella trichopoda]